MYLEISPRQTGKTSRLVTAVKHHVLDGGSAAVFANNMAMCQNIKQYFTDKELYNVDFFSSMERFEKSLIGRRPHKNKYKIFVDEFDFMQSKNVPLDRDGYYVGTPMKLRTLDDIVFHKQGIKPDTLLELLEMNKGKYEVQSVYDRILEMSISDLVSYKQMLSTEQLSAEFYGEWVAKI